MLLINRLPHKEAEQAEEGVHEADVVADSRDDGLLAVWAYRLYRRRLEHLTLQHGYRGSGARRPHHRGRVSHSRATVAGPWNELPRHGVGEVSRRGMIASWETEKKQQQGK